MSRVIGDHEILQRLRQACLENDRYDVGGLDESDLAEVAGVLNLDGRGTRAKLRRTLCAALYPDKQYNVFAEDEEFDWSAPITWPAEEPPTPEPTPPPTPAPVRTQIRTQAPVQRRAQRKEQTPNAKNAAALRQRSKWLVNDIMANIQPGMTLPAVVFQYGEPGSGNPTDKVFYPEKSAGASRVPYMTLLRGPGRESKVMSGLTRINELLAEQGLVATEQKRGKLWQVVVNRA